MTCRHIQGDPSCGSYPKWLEEQEDKKLLKSIKAGLGPPQAGSYSIEEMARVGANVILKVKYPSCAGCSYEGFKVMVFLNVVESDAMKWQKIDPHFSDPSDVKKPNEAPSPAARFPASKEGWNDAIEYAESKERARHTIRKG